MSSITVKIFGEEYNIRSSDDPVYVHKVADYLDKKMREIAESTSLVSSSKIAVLASLNIADELFRLRESCLDDEQTVNSVILELIKVLDQAMK